MFIKKVTAFYTKIIESVSVIKRDTISGKRKVSVHRNINNNINATSLNLIVLWQQERENHTFFQVYILQSLNFAHNTYSRKRLELVAFRRSFSFKQSFACIKLLGLCAHLPYVDFAISLKIV